MHRSRKSIASSLMVEALLLLLEKEEYDFISVKDICEKAGVNRSTFYTYYNTKDDLLVDTMKLISKRLLSNFDYDTITLKVDIENNFQLIGEIYLVPYLNTIKELRKVYKMLQHKPHIFLSQYLVYLSQWNLHKPSNFHTISLSLTTYKYTFSSVLPHIYAVLLYI